MGTILKKTGEVVKHSLARTLSVVCVMLVLGGIGWAVYAGIIRPVTKPIPTTTQKADKITNNYNNPKPQEIANVIEEQVKKRRKKFFLGVVLWGVELGVGK